MRVPQTKGSKRVSELKPCPFCGSDALEFEFAQDNPAAAAYVECECGARGPLVNWEDGKLARLLDARDEWNTRHVESENSVSREESREAK